MTNVFLHAWQTINKYYNYFLTYMKNQGTVEPDQFCWGARTSLTELKKNLPSSCSGGPLMRQVRIQTCFDTVQLLWAVKKLPKFFPCSKRKHSRLKWQKKVTKRNNLLLQHNKSFLKCTKIHWHAMYHCYFEYVSGDVPKPLYPNNLPVSPKKFI